MFPYFCWTQSSVELFFICDKYTVVLGARIAVMSCCRITLHSKLLLFYLHTICKVPEFSSWVILWNKAGLHAPQESVTIHRSSSRTGTFQSPGSSYKDEYGDFCISVRSNNTAVKNQFNYLTIELSIKHFQSFIDNYNDSSNNWFRMTVALFLYCIVILYLRVSVVPERLNGPRPSGAGFLVTALNVRE